MNDIMPAESGDTNPASVLADAVLAGLRATAPGVLGDWTPEDLLAAFRGALVDEAIDTAHGALSYRPETDLDHSHNIGVGDAAAAIAKRFGAGVAR